MSAPAAELVVRYQLTLAAGEDAEARARHLVREQTVEVPPGVASPQVEARTLGRIRYLAPAGKGGRRFRLEAGFPGVTVGADLPQLLNLLFGNISLQRGIRVEGVDWPAELLAALPGPTFGVEGLRELAGAPAGRPLLAGALKPLGLPSRDLARLAGECARGGLDLVKDDHSLADQETAPFRQRVELCQSEIERANRAVGGHCLYVPNLTGPVDRLAERLEDLATFGCRAAMVAPMILGLDALRALAASSGLALVAHPALAGAFFQPRHGLVPPLLLGDLFRLAGADAVIYPNAGGRFHFTLADCRAIQRRLRARLGGKRAAFAVLGGGIDAACLAEWIPRYPADTVYLVGGSLLGARDLRAAAAELADVVRRVPPRRRA